MTLPSQPSPGPQPPAPAGRAPLSRPLRKRQLMVLPIIVIVVGVLVLSAMLLLGVLGNKNPGIGLIGLFLSGLTCTIGILLLRLLDRWEPEPPQLLLAAFFWGGGVSLILVLGLSPFIDPHLSDVFSSSVIAPIMEESSKGLFLVLVVLSSRRGRNEFNSLTDAIVYAGFVGIGFSFIEDTLYIAEQSTVNDAVTLAGMRLGLGAFSHSFYTTMTAIGLWKGVNSRGAMRFIWPFGGWLLAVCLHGLHNFSAALGEGAYFLTLLVIALPMVVIIVIAAVRSRRKEGAVVREQLPSMVHFGWITPAEAGWLGTLKSRKEQLARAKADPTDRRRMIAFCDNATELAFVRDRLDKQQAKGIQLSPELLAHHQELVGLLENNASWVNERLAPHAEGWPAIQGQQTAYYPGQQQGLPPQGPSGPGVH